MLYPERQQPFSMKIFENPPANYRDVPFWAWNTAMTKEDIDFCLTVFRDMGMGGGFLHSRTGAPEGALSYRNSFLSAFYVRFSFIFGSCAFYDASYARLMFVLCTEHSMF